jgi:hypothetical protein
MVTKATSRGSPGLAIDVGETTGFQRAGVSASKSPRVVIVARLVAGGGMGGEGGLSPRGNFSLGGPAQPLRECPINRLTCCGHRWWCDEGGVRKEIYGMALGEGAMASGLAAAVKRLRASSMALAR